MTRSHITGILTVIAIGDAVVLGAIVGVASGSPVIGVAIGAASIAAIWGVVIAVGTMIVRTGTWATLWRRYPGAGDDPGAGRPRIISLALGRPWWQINNAVEARAGDTCLRLRVAVPVIGNDRALAIPWEAVRAVEPASFGRARLDVEGIPIWVPRVVVRDELALREAMGDSGATDGAPNTEVAS